jgi:hypothetical protein
MEQHFYFAAYKNFKKLPIINAIWVAVCAFVWDIVDAFAGFTEIGRLGFGGFVLWLLIGGISSALAFWFTAIMISPTILRTDATMFLSRKFGDESEEKARESVTIIEANEEKAREHVTIIKANSEREEPAKTSAPSRCTCQLCDKVVENLTDCKIVDNMGVRYRSVCDECLAELKANKQV